MKVLVLNRCAKDVEKHDYRDRLVIKVDGKEMLDVYDGEPEDNNLSRNFNDCLQVPDLMKLAYEAGKKGEELEVEFGDINEE